METMKDLRRVGTNPTLNY